MKKIKLLFKIGYIYHKAAIDPVIDLIMEDDKYDVWFSLDMEKKRYLFFDFPYTSKAIGEWKKMGYRFTDDKKGFDIVVAGDILRNAEEYGKTLMIMHIHGTGIKYSFHRNLARFPGHKYQIFVEGHPRVESFLNCDHLGKSQVHLVGLPKIDYFFQGRYDDKKSMLNNLGLDPEKKTVLYAPTYKPTSLYIMKDDIFEYTKDYNLIIKLHPYSWMGKYAPHKQHRIYERRVKKYDHAILLPFEEYNIVPYQALADTAIGEASASLFDYIALNKFGIIVDLPCEKLVHSDGKPYLETDNRELFKGAFIHIEKGEELPDAIKQALNPTEKMKQKAEDYRNKYFYGLDGKASERFIKKMEELYYAGCYENDPK